MVFRLLLKRSTTTKLLYTGWALTAVLYTICYRSIAGALGEAAAAWWRALL